MPKDFNELLVVGMMITAKHDIEKAQKTLARQIRSNDSGQVASATKYEMT